MIGIQCDSFYSAWRSPGTSRSWKHVHWGPSPWVSGNIVYMPSCQEDSLQPGGPLAPEGNMTGQPDGVEALKQTFTPIAQSISIFFLILTFFCYAWFDHWNTSEVVTRMTMTFLFNMAVAYIFRWQNKKKRILLIYSSTYTDKLLTHGLLVPTHSCFLRCDFSSVSAWLQGSDVIAREEFYGTAICTVSGYCIQYFYLR